MYKINYVYLEELVDISIHTYICMHISIYLQTWQSKCLLAMLTTRKEVENNIIRNQKYLQSECLVICILSDAFSYAESL